MGDKSSLDYFGSVRGRVGYAFDRALVYGTGGFGYGQVTNDGFSETADRLGRWRRRGVQAYSGLVYQG